MMDGEKKLRKVVLSAKVYTKQKHFSDKWIEKAPTSSTDPACLLSPAKEDATASVEARLGLPVCSLFHTRTSK